MWGGSSAPEDPLEARGGNRATRASEVVSHDPGPGRLPLWWPPRRAPLRGSMRRSAGSRCRSSPSATCPRPWHEPCNPRRSPGPAHRRGPALIVRRLRGVIGLQLSFGFEMTTGFEMRASPELVTCMHMLAMSGTELEQAVAEKLAENPALELDEQHPHATAEPAGPELPGPVAPGADRAGEPRPSVASFPAAAADPLALAGQQMSPAEQLLSDVAAVIPQA